MTFAPTPLAAVREARAWREVIAPTHQVIKAETAVVVIVAVGRWERSRCSMYLYCWGGGGGGLLVAGRLLGDGDLLS